MRLIFRMILWRRLKAPEEILRKLASGVPVPEQFRFVETRAELFDHRGRIVGHIEELSFDQ